MKKILVVLLFVMFAAVPVMSQKAGGPENRKQCNADCRASKDSCIKEANKDAAKIKECKKKFRECLKECKNQFKK